MVVVMEERATEEQIENVVARLVDLGMDVHRSTGVVRTVLGVVGQNRYRRSAAHSGGVPANRHNPHP